MERVLRVEANMHRKCCFFTPKSPPGSAMSQLAGRLGSFGAIGVLGGLKNPGNVYVGIIGSRTIADALIQRFRVFTRRRD